MATDQPETTPDAGLPPGAVVNRISPEKQRAIYRAKEDGAAGVPKRVLDAALPEELKAAGLALQKFHPNTYLALRKINALALASEEKARAATEEEKLEDAVRTIYVLTTPIKQVRAELARGPEFFNEQANAAIGDRVELKDMPAIAAAIHAHIGRAFATVPGGLDVAGEETTGGEAAVEGADGSPKAEAAAPAAAGSPA